jgi:hypothetical protein
MLCWFDVLKDLTDFELFSLASEKTDPDPDVPVSLKPKFAITTKLKSIQNKPGEIANISCQ